MAENLNDLSMRDNNQIDNVTQIRGDKNIVTNTELNLTITGVSSSSVTVNQYCGNNNDAQQKEPNSTRSKDNVSSSNLSVEEIKNILRKKYRKLTFPTAPWLKDVDELLIEEHFVQLELQDTNETIPLENIFIEEELKREIDWIYIEAPPGFGKTTLAYKLVTDWVANKKYVQKFEMAFLVILRYLQGKTVKTMMSEIIEQTDEEKVWELINKKGTLIIFDGLDEIGDEDKSKIVQLDFEGTIIITGRTGSHRFQMNPRKELKKLSNPQKSNIFWDRRITITGIDERNRIKFLGQFFNQNSKWPVIKTKIVESKNALGDLFKSPLMLILLVYVLSENPQLNIDNMTKTELYKNLKNCLVIRSQSKINKNIKSSFNLFSDSISPNDKIIEIFIEFGELALEKFNYYNLQFEENETVKNIYEMGFLIKHETKEIFKTKVHYEALHLSMIEFAVALSLWLSYKKSEKFSIKQLNFIRGYMFDEIPSLVILFLCGLMGEKVNELFNELKPHCGLMIEGDNSFLLAECYKNDSFGEAISPFIPSVLTIECKPWNELLQLIEYGIQFNKLKYILIHADYFKYLPVDLTGVYIHVQRFKTTKTIVKRKCKKIKFFFDTELSADELEFALNTFNIIDCESKKIKIDVSIVSNLVKLCLENKWIITKLDKLEFYFEKEIRSEDIVAINQFITSVTKNCQVERFEVWLLFDAPLEKTINLISKLSFLKSVNICEMSDVTDLILFAKLHGEMSVDLEHIEIVSTNINQIMCENKSVIQKSSKFLNKNVCNHECRMTFTDCLISTTMLISEIEQSSSGLNDSIFQLKFFYSRLMKYKDRDELFKNLTKCDRVKTITFRFNETDEIIDFMKEYPDAENTIFSQVNLIIEIDRYDITLEQISDIITKKRVKTLVLKIPCVMWNEFSFFLNLLQFVRSGEIDDLEIYLDWTFSRAIFIPYFDKTELELVWKHYGSSFKITRKCKGLVRSNIEEIIFSLFH